MTADAATKDRRSMKITGEDAHALRELAWALGFENPRHFRSGNTSEMLRALAAAYRAEPQRLVAALQTLLDRA
jgi:hypothetical protein